MTQEEKEREAERLFVLFDRIEKNPVLSMSSDTGGHPQSEDGDVKGKKEKGKGKEKKGFSIKDMMRDKLESGEMESWDLKEAEETRRMAEEEEKREEEEVGREMRRYKERKTGRK